MIDENMIRALDREHKELMQSILEALELARNNCATIMRGELLPTLALVREIQISVEACATKVIEAM